jgi:regulator of RNase E activity RraA
VIPQAHLARAVEGARSRAAKEVAIRARIEGGESLFEILNMEAAVRAAGIEQVDKTWLEVRDRM